MNYTDEIRLSFGHSLVNSHLPSKIKLEALREIGTFEARKQIERFGLFDIASPNFSQYYPDVTESDLKPTDDQFIMPTYRALSQVVVHKEWNPVDFSEGTVLKDSMSLLVGQSVYPNHEAVVGNELGAVYETAWDDSYKVNGIKVPAGINSRLKIDGKSNPKIARGILMDPPSIHSTSVTVSFLWRKSHESLTEEEFWRKLGTYDADGALIRRIASKVKSYREISLVSHGADAFAQKVGADGKIVNPTYANIVYNSDTPVEVKKNSTIFLFSFKTDLVDVKPDEDTIQNSNTTPTNSNNNNLNNPSMDRQFLISLAALIGINATDVPEGDAASGFISNKLTELKNAHDTFEAMKPDDLKNQIVQLKNELDAEKAKNAGQVDSAKLVEFQTNITKQLRDTAKANYTKLAGDKPLESVTKLLESADYSTLVVLNDTYVAQLEEKFPAVCQSCGSHEVSRQSAASNAEGEQGGGKQNEAGSASLHDRIYEEQNNFGITKGSPTDLK